MSWTMAATDPIAELRAAVDDAARALRDGEPTGPEPTLDRPPKPELGDYSSNAAMLLAAPLGEQPRDVAERLRAELEGALSDSVERVEVAGPGFVNLFLSDSWYRRAMTALAAAGDDLGRSRTDAPERVLVEFVSANPTGPLHVGGGRHAAYGDSLVRLLEAVGNEVGREFYINDAGGQVDRFAASIAARMTGAEPPEDGYGGEYVVELAERLAEEGVDPADAAALGRRGVELMIEAVRATLDRFGVRFDTWFSERDLYQRGEVEAALGQLRERDHTYESEGALWLRTTEFGDDKDRVLIRAGGEPTYLAADVAYHWDKLERGFERLIDVLGADHHGYVARLRAAIEALGADPGHFEALIMRLVHIVEGGERAQMSKRSGDFVSLDELIDDIGVDAVRWFMLWRSHDTQVDLDLELARRQSNENPVYYVQYAHARIASILRKAGEGAETSAEAGAAGGSVPLEPAERALVKRLLEFPEEVREAATRRAPHRICAYSMTVAADFHAFYRDCQVVGAEGEGVEQARLALCLLTKRTIAGSLGLLGISAPERM
jgi:arginyl-tRNA synthetase